MNRFQKVLAGLGVVLVIGLSAACSAASSAEPTPDVTAVPSALRSAIGSMEQGAAAFLEPLLEVVPLVQDGSGREEHAVAVGHVGSDEEFIAPVGLTGGVTVGGKAAKEVGCNGSLVLLTTAGLGPYVQPAESALSVGAPVIAILFGGIGKADVVVLLTTTSGTVPINTSARLTPGEPLVTASPSGLELVGVVVDKTGDWVPVTRATVSGLAATPGHC